MDTIEGSKFPNMKELRPTNTIRIFFAFDPNRSAIMLIGGDKAGKPQRRWYTQLVRKADELYEKHLKTLR